MAMTLKRAVEAVEKYGVCLVFPIDNSRDTPSLWYHFFPKSPMRWEWDANGDNRVAELWHLREQLSRSGKVVYAKWFKGRATLFSHSVFTDLLTHLNHSDWSGETLPPASQEILSILQDNSPLSTKQLKRAADLVGRDFEAAYTRALKALWDRLLIVGFGEVDDGAFPSLAIGSTQHLFESLWWAGQDRKTEPVAKRLAALFTAQPPVAKQVSRLLRSRSAAGEAGA